MPSSHTATTSPRELLRSDIVAQLTLMYRNDPDGDFFEFPDECYLTVRDVWALYDHKVSFIDVVPPQNFNTVRTLTAEDFMMRGDGNDLTLFQGCERRKKSVCACCAAAEPVFSGSGSDPWLKADHALLAALRRFNSSYEQQG